LNPPKADFADAQPAAGSEILPEEQKKQVVTSLKLHLHIILMVRQAGFEPAA